MAVPHQRGLLRNFGPASLMRVAWTTEGSACLPAGRSEQAVHYSMAFANFCATSSRMGLQAQMVSASLAHPRQAQRVG